LILKFYGERKKENIVNLRYSVHVQTSNYIIYASLYKPIEPYVYCEFRIKFI